MRLIMMTILFTLALGISAFAAGSFFRDLSDVPVMPGLTERPAESLVFDEPGGRIVEAVAAGPVAAAQIRDFYAGTLPQLGWQADKAGRYERQSETLSLDIADKGGQRILHVRVAPAK